MVAKELLNSAKACVLVICPLTSIIQDQIAEAKAPGITCVSLLDLEEVTRVFFSRASDGERRQRDRIEIHQSQPHSMT